MRKYASELATALVADKAGEGPPPSDAVVQRLERGLRQALLVGAPPGVSCMWDQVGQPGQRAGRLSLGVAWMGPARGMLQLRPATMQNPASGGATPGLPYRDSGPRSWRKWCTRRHPSC